MAKKRQGKISVEAHERRIQGVFRKAWVENEWSAATDRTPLDDLMAEEFDGDDFSNDEPGGAYSWPNEHRKDLELSALKAEEAAAVAAWARRRLVMWIIGNGLHPFHIVQRVYALLFARYQEFIGPMNMTWLAEILNQGRAAFQAVVKRLFTRPVQIKSGVMMLSPGMKSAESREQYAANAKRNTPRREINAASVDDKAEKAAEAQRRHEQAEKVRLAREDYERRKLAEEFGGKPEDYDLSKHKLKDTDHDDTADTDTDER